MILAAVAVNLIHQDLNAFYWRELVDAVSKIEHVAAVLDWTEAINDTANFASNRLLSAEKNIRIQITLQSNAIRDLTASTRNID